MKCPGQDLGRWKPEDVFDLRCPACGAPVEFFKDDKWRECRECGSIVRKSRLVRTCREWCSSSDECV